MILYASVVAAAFALVLAQNRRAPHLAAISRANLTAAVGGHRERFLVPVAVVVVRLAVAPPDAVEPDAIVADQPPLSRVQVAVVNLVHVLDVYVNRRAFWYFIAKPPEKNLGFYSQP